MRSQAGSATRPSPGSCTSPSTRRSSTSARSSRSLLPGRGPRPCRSPCGVGCCLCEPLRRLLVNVSRTSIVMRGLGPHHDGEAQMKNPGSIGLFVLIPLMAAATVCRGEDAATSGVRSAIEQAGARFSEAYAKGDARAVAAFYAEDAIAFPPGGDMVKGRQAIQQMWQSTMDSGVKRLSFTVVDVGTSGDLAHETGTALLNVHAQGKDPTTASIKYVVVWKRQGNDWKLLRDIWNDLPAK